MDTEISDVKCKKKAQFVFVNELIAIQSSGTDNAALEAAIDLEIKTYQIVVEKLKWLKTQYQKNRGHCDELAKQR